MAASSVWNTPNLRANRVSLYLRLERKRRLSPPFYSPSYDTKSSIYANNSVEAVIAADAASQNADPNAAMPSYDTLAERMAVPMPNSDEVEAAQKVAMGDTQIPVIDPNATLAANALSQPSDAAATEQVASADPAGIPAELATNTLPTADEKTDILARHKRLARAIANRDPQDAEQAMAAHFDEAIGVLLRSAP